MESITEYLLSITAAAVVCAVAKHLIGEKSPMGKIINVLCGVFMAVTAISPLVKVRLEAISGQVEHYISEGKFHTDNGNEFAEKEMTEIIKQKAEAYILDEADRLSLNLTADVSLSEDGSLFPEHVVITGAVSPYYKKVLSEYIEESLGISGENQEWI